MGDTLGREFSLNPVDTGRRTPQPDITTPPFLPGGNPPGMAPQQPQPGAPITRPSFLQAFLANLGPALAGGLVAQPGAPFGTGLGGALQNIEEQKRYNSQLGLQQQAAQRAAAQQASTQALQQAELSRIQQLLPYEVQQKKIQQDLMMAQFKFFSDLGTLSSAVNDATQNLGKLNSDEQAQIDTAKKEAQVTRKFDPINAAVTKIAQERATTARQNLETTPFKAWRQEFINQNGREPNAKEIQDFTTAGQGIRIAGMENLRQDNYLDTSSGEVSTMTAGEFAAANKANPGQFVKFSGQVSNAMKGQSLINDIRDGIKQMRAAVNDPKFKLSPSGRALMEVASNNPQTAVATVIAGSAAKKLSPEEQNYIIAHATLLERAMSLRGLQGQGAGSDQQRQAIAAMLPNLATGDKNMAEKQLKTLENNVDNVASAIPKLGKKGNGGSKRRVIDLTAP